LISSDSTSIWAAGDGGVFEDNLQTGVGWTVRNEGLHTHHVHSMVALPLNLELTYATQDNSSWNWSFADGWSGMGSGDESVALADRGAFPGFAVTARNAQTASLHQFAGPPSQRIALTTQTGLGTGQAVVNFIQTPNGAPDTPPDAVMLANLPLSFPAGGQLTDGDQTMAVVRNRSWLSQPDFATTNGQGWEILADNLPSGTLRFWAANGHTSTRLYLVSKDAAGGTHLWRSEGGTPLSTWTELHVRNTPTAPIANLLLGRGNNGPVFVNPYNANVIYALTDQGVELSTTSGDAWTNDAQLQSLATENGTYPLTAEFSGGNGTGVDVSSRFGDVLNFMSFVSDIEFDRYVPTRAVASSPFTGVFLNNGNGEWDSLTSVLPRPLAPVSSVALSANGLLVGTEGRGVIRVTGVLDIPSGTLSVNRVGSGRITSSPGGIDCGATCSATFDLGQVVTLTATPDPGWVFTGWSSPCAAAAADPAWLPPRERP
jgi:hypothetical protein